MKEWVNVECICLGRAFSGQLLGLTFSFHAALAVLRKRQRKLLTCCSTQCAPTSRESCTTKLVPSIVELVNPQTFWHLSSTLGGAKFCTKFSFTVKRKWLPVGVLSGIMKASTNSSNEIVACLSTLVLVS